jgi:hypothetical protein
VACTGSESDLSVCVSIFQARSDCPFPMIGVGTTGVGERLQIFLDCNLSQESNVQDCARGKSGTGTYRLPLYSEILKAKLLKRQRNPSG